MLDQLQIKTHHQDSGSRWFSRWDSRCKGLGPVFKRKIDLIPDDLYNMINWDVYECEYLRKIYDKDV